MSEKHWDKAVVQLPPKWTNSEGAIFDTRRRALRAEAVLYVMRRHLEEWVAEGTTVFNCDAVVKNLPDMAEELVKHFYDIDHGDYDEGP